MVKLQIKLVAVFVLLAVLAAPASTLASCVTASLNHSENACPPDCAMMAEMHDAPATSVQAQPQGQSCCEISSGKTAPAWQWGAPMEQSAALGSIPHTPSAVVHVSAHGQSCDNAPPMLSAPSQAGLCTFLI